MFGVEAMMHTDEELGSSEYFTNQVTTENRWNKKYLLLNISESNSETSKKYKPLLSYSIIAQQLTIRSNQATQFRWTCAADSYQDKNKKYADNG